MKSHLPFVALSFALLALPVSTWAFKDPATPYSATRVMKSDVGSVTAKIYHVKGKDRIEMEQGGQETAMILRQDKNVAWQLIPQAKFYMEMPLNRAPGNDFGGELLEQTALGTEDVNGFTTTKYKIVFTDDSGARGEGFVWVTAEDIAVKMVSDVQSEGRTIKVEMELQDLKIGSQPDALFEIPTGYNKMGQMGAGAGQFNPGNLPRMGGSPPQASTPDTMPDNMSEATPAATNESAQRECLKQKIAEAQTAKEKKKGLGRLLGAVSRTAARLGGSDVAGDISKAARTAYDANATADDLSIAARELGISEDAMEQCRNP